ncbi:MAG: TonB-dependent receptor [Bacteroidales bacterium]|nr:TonB-dependent receptor [Bacteroidales bacterium]
MKKKKTKFERLAVIGQCKQKRKVILFVLLIAFFYLPLTTYSQEKTITLNKQSVDLEEVLKEIQKQTGLNYIFNHEEIRETTKITIKVTSQPVSKVLELCLKNTNLSFKIVDNVIVIIPKPIKNTSQLTQVIWGKVVDADAQNPLSFASVAISTTDPMLGVMTDDEGNFRIEDVPIGRHNIQVSFIGYETQIIPELLVTTGKEIVLNIKLKEKIAELKEIQIKAFTAKDKPLNNMATASARTFSVEEARRYAGGFDDPGRLATSFAGVTTENSRDNTIIIRGNSPKGLLWRLEGVEISNPNHFANQATYGGGGISALSALVVGNSDFFTGAFPAEYGNATSGVFDIKLRTGNNENHEHAFQIGTMGIDVSSEGPFSKNSKASYLFNYRYSTFGLMKEIFPEDLKQFLPVYQDLCFKLNMPTQKSGVFSIWGLSSADKSNFPAVEDTSKWETSMNRLDNKVIMGIAAMGINHRYIFGKQSWLNTSIAVSGDYMKYEDDMLDYDLVHHDYNNIDVLNYKYTYTSVYNRKFSAKHSNRTGIIVDNLRYDLDLQYAPVIGQDLISIAKEKGYSNMVQFFSQSKFNVAKNILVNAGLNGSYFDLNNEFIVEPRFGLTYNLNKSQSISLAYGKHSRLEPMTIYFAKVNNGSSENQPNKDLEISKAHHFVLAYDISLNSNVRLKIEPYFQYLYDVPAIPDSNYSVLNMETEWFSFDKELINSGTGKNMGIDITLERFLQNGYYYLFTASFFDSKYKGDDGIEHNTRFNTNYVINLLYGKEWIVGPERNKILGVNTKVNFFGGKRTTPINQTESAIEEDVVFFNERLFNDKESNKFNVNFTINYRINKEKHTSIWSLQMMNAFLASENYGYFYNYKKQRVEPWELAVPTPNLSYKIEF